MTTFSLRAGFVRSVALLRRFAAPGLVCESKKYFFGIRESCYAVI